MKRNTGKATKLTVGAWNVRTLLDSTKADRPDRRTALVGRELARYNVDIAALSETRFPEEGHLTERGAGYTFFWIGRKTNERREAGVGFAIKTQLVGNLTSSPKGINDRLMVMQLPLTNNGQATIISAYAPTMTNPDEAKDRFYEELDSTIKSVPKTDKLILLGDFNARVGSDHQAWDGVIGKNGIGKCNSNGLLLLQTCSAHDLIITNSLFQLPNRNKTTWMHPRSKHWHLLDYVITRKKDRQDVCVTKAMCGAECWTDHRLVISKLRLHIRPKRRPQGKKPPRKLNTSKLKVGSTVDDLIRDLNSKLTDLHFGNASIEEEWAALRDLVYNASLDLLGPATRKHQDWFDENDEAIQELLQEKHRLHLAFQNDPTSMPKKKAFTNSRRKVQKVIRTLQDSWLSNKADEIQTYADRHDSKRFYDSLKAVYGPPTSGTAPVLASDGSTLLTDRSQILERWAEHFDSVLNRPSSINDAAINRLPQVTVNTEMDQPPCTAEVIKAITQLSCGKAPGSDAIPAEIYKSGGPMLTEKLTELFVSCWNKRTLPQEFKDASIVHLYKRKGNRQSCDNHRGISLLSIAGKILARVLLNRLIKHLEQDLLPESQCGFRAGRGTVDMIFAARQLQEKCQEQHQDLYSTFVDLTKAFDTVSRQGLWKIMAKFGCPENFVCMVQQFHDGMMARVLDDGEASTDFPVSNGVKQGCVLAPTLFSMMFSAMLNDAFSSNDPGVDIRYRTDGKLYNPRRLKAVTKVKNTIIRDLLFADDCALNATSENQMQSSMDKFSVACDNFGLTISTKKTEVMFQPAPGKVYSEPKIQVKGVQLQAVEKFTYLGSTLSRCIHIDDEINSRISKASAAFGRLRTTVWERRGIKLSTKIKVYKAIVLTTLLYASESWTVYSRHARRLNHFHTSCLRKLLHIRWQEKVPDTAVLARANLPSVHTLLQKSQVRWAGHVSRMPENRIPKQLLYGELSSGGRSVGGQKKRFKDSLKVSLKCFNIDTNTWESQAQNRPSWRAQISRGANYAETMRTNVAKEKRQLRKTRSASSDTVPTDNRCSTCGRYFRARIGLQSHLRTHRCLKSWSSS